MLRSELEQHIDLSCPETNIACNLCDVLVKRKNINNHIETTCLMADILCKCCGMKLLRG